jgi:hypothetical protein
MGKVWAPGETLAEGWIEQPVHPSLTLAVRSGNTLLISGHEIVDSFGHFGLFVSFHGATFTLLISVNGRPALFASGAFPFPAATVSLPSASAAVDVVMLMNPNPSWSRLAQTTATHISFTTSAAAPGLLALPTANYPVFRLNLLNQVTTDENPTMLKFNVDLTSPTGQAISVGQAAVALSVNDGATWFPAKSVGVGPTGLQVKALVPTAGPGPSFVSVMVHVVATDGTVFDQQITRSMQIVPSAQGGP